MIYLYWPRKTVPEWLEKIRFYGESNGVPLFYHNGFGFVLKRNGRFHVFSFFGSFIYVNARGMSVELIGGGEGVYTYSSLIDAIKNTHQSPDSR